MFGDAKVGEVKKVTIIRRGQNEGEHAGKSRGYGFVQMDSKENAKKAVKRLQNFMLDDHALKLSLVEKSISEAESAQKTEKLLKKRTHSELGSGAAKATGATNLSSSEEALSEKLLVKNLAFEATPEEIRELFMAYGHIKQVRLPKKVNSKNHRGFGFVEFATKEEAKMALRELASTHLYGRKVVIEYAK